MASARRKKRRDRMYFCLRFLHFFKTARRDVSLCRLLEDPLGAARLSTFKLVWKIGDIQCGFQDVLTGVHEMWR